MDVLPSRPPMEKITPATGEDCPAVEVEPPPQPASTPEQASQSTDAFVFTEADLRTLLVKYEYLVQQEVAAQREHCSHETALPMVMRQLKAGKVEPPDRQATEGAHRLLRPRRGK